MSTAGVCKLWKKYEKTGNIVKKRGSGQTSKLTNEIKILIEEKLKHEDETSLHTSTTNNCYLVVTRCDGWYGRCSKTSRHGCPCTWLSVEHLFLYDKYHTYVCTYVHRLCR